VSARAAADTASQTTRAQIESERKASKTKLAAMEAELKKVQLELASVTTAANTKKRKPFGKLF
jgi:hypothetical protein